MRNIAFIIVLGVARSASAQPSEPTLGKPSDSEASRQYREGNGHYKVREYALAIDRYAASIKIEESQAALYNIAQSHRQLGHYEDAIWFYRRLIDSAALAGPPREQIEQLIAAMKRELDKQAASTPPLDVAHTRDAVESASAGGDQDDTAEPTLAAARWYHDRIGWGLTAGALVAGGGALALALAGDRAQRDANREPNELTREDLQERADSRRTWAAAAGFVGGGLLIGGVIRLALVPSAPELHVAVASRGLAIMGRF